jgi:methionyl-tRNA formyltransferase
MRLVFFGSGAFGLPSLEHLARHHDIAGVISQPDRPAGRGGSLTPTPIAAWAAANLKSPLLKPEKVNAMAEEIRAARADAWVVIAFGQKLGQRLLDGMFAINLHASLLPRWRGAAPINAALLAGDPVTGNSIITLADRMDAGEVLAQSRREVDAFMTAGELHDVLAADGPALIERVLADYRGNSLSRSTQDESRVTIAPKLSKADGWVNFDDPADVVRRRIHGLTPWPGVTVRFRDEPLKLMRAKVAVGSSDQGSGKIVDTANGLVACRGSLLQLLEVHPAGRRQMSWSDFSRGHRIQSGEQLIGGRPQ